MPGIKKEIKQEKKPEIDFDKEKYERAKSMLEIAKKNIDRAFNYIEKIEQDDRKDYYKSIPGIEGIFDGEFLISEDGKKKKVPTNYSAKSRLVFGDRLKVFEDGARDLYKQIDRVERKKIEGILTKKEGKWFILSDSGSYKVSDTAADFYNAELNDEAEAFIPADNLKAPFATLDLVKKNKGDRSEKVGPQVKEKLAAPKISSKSRRRIPPNYKKSPKREKKPSVEKNTPKDSAKEYVANILDDDDLR